MTDNAKKTEFTMLKTSDIAEKLKVPVSTIYSWARNLEIDPLKIPGNGDRKGLKTKAYPLELMEEIKGLSDRGIIGAGVVQIREIKSMRVRYREFLKTRRTEKEEPKPKPKRSHPEPEPVFIKHIPPDPEPEPDPPKEITIGKPLGLSDIKNSSPSPVTESQYMDSIDGLDFALRITGKSKDQFILDAVSSAVKGLENMLSPECVTDLMSRGEYGQAIEILKRMEEKRGG